jgi:uncharacterized membrane protein YfcA
MNLIDIQIIFFFLIIIQTILGVGILVLGTPILLLFNHDIIEIISILLPLSILTSLINLSYQKLKKKELNIFIDRQTKIFFFLICLPCIFVGLMILKKFGNNLDFRTIVALVILFSIFLSTKKNFFNKLNNQIKKILLGLIGIIHGLTNSGGSLLALMFSNEKNKNNSRYNITYFYFYLALAQYLLFALYFKNSLVYYFDKYFFLLFIISIILGNLLISYLNEKFFKQTINLICIFTCFILLSTD